MSHLDRLIAEHCPDGVEYRNLGDLCSFLRGRKLQPAELIPGPYPVVTANREAVASHVAFSHGSMAVTVTSHGANAGHVNFWCEPIWLGNNVYLLAPDQTALTPRFFYYALKCAEVQIRQRVRGGGIPYFNAKDITPIKLPLPPLVVQQEIAGTLEKMEALQAELQAERQARQLQYAHYRTRLLSFPEGTVRWVTLDDVSRQVSSGATPTAGRPEYYDAGSIPWLRTQEVRFMDIHDTEMRITERALAETAVKWIPENCVIIAISGATAGRSAVNKVRMTTNQHCCNLEIDESVANYRFVYQWVRSNYDKLKNQGQGARADLNMGMIRKFPIPLPNLAEQGRIASTLDAFDALVNDWSSGLPAEIEARRKQYEFYRDRLLSFEEKVA